MHFPIAISKDTSSLANILDVPNGKACNCYCDGCKQTLIAANNGEVRVAHFKHEKNDANCPFNTNYETYIHWLAKEIFKTLENINLPSIRFNNLSFNHQEHTKLVNTFKKYLNDAGILESEYNSNQLSLVNTILQRSKTYKIDGWAIEQPIETGLGKIVVDIVLQINKTQLFIEPYWTNPISADKITKLANYNTSTIAIDLSSFVKKQFFTIAEFTKFLENDISSKSWTFINTIKTAKLISNLFSEIFKLKLEEKKIQVLKNRNISTELNKKMIEINTKEIEVIKLRQEAEDLSSKIIPINLNDLFS